VVAVRARVVRDGVEVLSLPASAPQGGAAKDPARVPYSGELSLAELAAGRYVLEVTAEDAGAKATATQQAEFVVE
jgi:hypothetical protein